MPGCSSTKCNQQAVGMTTFCNAHRNGLRLCEYKACRNAAADDELYCRAHKDGAANRVKNSLVPKKEVALNDNDDVKRWLALAGTRMKSFNEGVSKQFIEVFFGVGNAPEARKVFSKMPDALSRFEDGTFKIVQRDVYTVTSTPNAVNSGTGLLSVSPGFLDLKSSSDEKKAFVLIHESAHAAWVVDKSFTFVTDHAYHPGGSFDNLRPSQRLRNADHYRMCVQTFCEGKKASECDAFAVINQDLPSGGGGKVVRKVTQDWPYARYVIDAAVGFHTHVWLHLFDSIISGTEAYHDHPGTKGGQMGHRGTRLKPVLGSGKSSSTFKAKDYVRLEDLYHRTRDWIDYLTDDAIVDYEDVYDANLRDLERVTLEKDGANRTFKVTSNFDADRDMTVGDKALASGVRQVVAKVLQERPYPKVDRSDLVKWAKSRAGNSAPGWYAHL